MPVEPNRPPVARRDAHRHLRLRPLRTELRGEKLLLHRSSPEAPKEPDAAAAHLGPIRPLTRSVIDPRDQGAGIAARFLRRCCEMVPYPWIEQISSLTKAAPFLAKLPRGASVAPNAVMLAANGLTFAPSAPAFSPAALTVARDVPTFAPAGLTFAPVVPTWAANVLTFAQNVPTWALNARTFAPKTLQMEQMC